MDDEQLVRLYESKTSQIAESVLKVSGDVVEFRPADYEEMKYIVELDLTPAVELFYKRFAPQQPICGDDAVLLPVDGMDWNTNEAVPGNQISQFGYSVIATNYSGLPYCILNKEMTELYGPEVVTFGMRDYSKASAQEVREFARPVAQNFAEFLNQFVD